MAPLIQSYNWWCIIWCCHAFFGPKPLSRITYQTLTFSYSLTEAHQLCDARTHISNTQQFTNAYSDNNNSTNKILQSTHNWVYCFILLVFYNGAKWHQILETWVQIPNIKIETKIKPMRPRSKFCSEDQSSLETFTSGILLLLQTL